MSVYMNYYGISSCITGPLKMKYYIFNILSIM